MKVLLLTNEYPPDVYGGAGIHVQYLSRELSKHIPVEVRSFGDHSLRLHNLSVKGYAVRGAEPKQCNPSLKSALSAFDMCLSMSCDPVDAALVHCHTWYTHFGGILIKEGHDIPMVLTTHSLEPLRPWKREQMKNGYDLSTWIERSALEKADAIVAVSQGTKDDILKLFRVDESRIKIIYNGIDTKEYAPVQSTDTIKELGVDPSVPFVLFVGRITRQKGILHLLEAAEHIDKSVQLVFAAGKPDTKEIEKEVTERVRALEKSRGNIVWIREWVDLKTKVELYSNAALFCCPSIYEPFGIINLEAMACGTPVVASDVGGIPEIVVEGKTGFLVPYETAEKGSEVNERFPSMLAERINELLRNTSLRETMGKASRTRVEELFSWETIAAQTVELYRSLQ